jgi:hypothetical protein
MFYQLLIIHLYRPFLKYTKANTPLPSHVSPRKICTQAAAAVSKLMRVYKRSYGLKQICNIAVYIAHTACTIHLLNLPDKNAQRDVIHGLRNLEEMAEGWLCARRTLRILDISATKWQVTLPPEATSIFERTHHKWGSWGSWDQTTTPSASDESSPIATSATFQPATSPSRFSAGLPQYQPRHTDSSSSLPTNPNANTNPVPMVGLASSKPQYPSSTTTPSLQPVSYPPMAVHPSLQPQLQRPEFAPPEPTYLRPSVTYQFPAMTVNAPSPSSPRQTWYDGIGAQIQPQNTTPASTASPVSGYDGTENLVEESQDWWSRNAALYNSLGMDGWGGGWSSPGQSQAPAQTQAEAHSSQMHYQNGNVGSPVDSGKPGHEDPWA